MRKVFVSLALVFGIIGIGALTLLFIWLTLDTFSESEYLMYSIGAMLGLLIGAVLFMCSLFTYLYARSDGRNCTVPVRAVISDIRERQVHIGNSRQPSTLYMPDYTYEYCGETRTAHSNMGAYSKKAYRIGDEVDMLIDPDSPYAYYLPHDVSKKVRRLNLIAAPLLLISAIGYYICVTL